MAKLYMLIGLPGSGKTSWANDHADAYNAKVMSSDAFRRLVCGSEEDQTRNNEVFAKMNDCVATLLENGRDVIYDATNLTRKNRERTMKYINYKVKNVEYTALIFTTPIEICKVNNQKRTRQVPGKVYDRMLRQFEMPLYSEGFEHIHTIDIFTSLLNPYSYIAKAYDFSQDHPRHAEDLYTHSILALSSMTENEQEIYPNLLCAAFLHDIGKLYTKTIDKDGVAHYIGHENYGAYLALSIDYKTVKKMISSMLEDEGDVSTLNSSDINPIEVATIINCHMMPINLQQGSMETCNKKSVLLQNHYMQHKRINGDTERLWDSVMTLHRCDLMASRPVSK